MTFTLLKFSLKWDLCEIYGIWIMHGKRCKQGSEEIENYKKPVVDIEQATKIPQKCRRCRRTYVSMMCNDAKSK